MHIAKTLSTVSRQSKRFFNPLVALESNLDEERERDRLKPNAQYVIKSKISRGIFNYQTFMVSKDIFEHRATKRFETEEIGDKQLKRLRGKSPKYVMHPCSFREDEEGYVLEFPSTLLPLRDFLEQWGPESECPPSIESILQILSNVRGCLLYLYETEKMTHGSLMQDGLVIRRDLECFLAHLNQDSPSLSHAASDLKDLQSLVTLMLSKITSTGHHSYDRLVQYEEFLNTNINKQSHHSLEEHLFLMVNHPVSWSMDDTLRFMNNMHKLYYDPCIPKSNTIKGQKSQALEFNSTFTTHMNNLYPNWSEQLDDPQLEAVFNAGNKRTRGQDIVPFVSIVLKHYTHQIEHTMLDLVSKQVMDKLQGKFPRLAPDTFHGMCKATGDGTYAHPRFTVHHIVSNRLMGG